MSEDPGTEWCSDLLVQYVVQSREETEGLGERVVFVMEVSLSNENPQRKDNPSIKVTLLPLPHRLEFPSRS